MHPAVWRGVVMLALLGLVAAASHLAGGNEPSARMLGIQSASNSSCADRVMVKFECTQPACTDKQQGYINYIYFKECTMQDVPAIAYILLVLLLLYFLFLLGDTADEYFCPALQSTVTILKLSPNIAGVTFLSFGNGAPDVFSSLAAFTHGTPKIGIGALVGAGIVVTMGVAGAVAVTCDAKINRRPFLRDCFFYIMAVCYLMLVFFDGKVVLGEALGFLGLYFLFVVVVGVGRVLYQKQKHAKNALEVAIQQQRQREQRQRPIKRALEPAGILQLRSRSQTFMRNAMQNIDNDAAQDDGRDRASSFDHSHAVHKRTRHHHWAQTYMEHLADYYDPVKEGDNVATQPFLRELSVSRSDTGLHSMDIETLEEGSQTLTQTLCEDVLDGKWYFRAFNIINFPAVLLRRMTVPLLDEDTWTWELTVIAPFCGLTLFTQVAFGLGTPVFGPVPWGVLSSVLGLAGSAVTYARAPRDTPPGGIAIVIWIFFAFVVSVVWIIILANEIVGLLLSLGLFLGVSNTILGLTVLAWGNSLGDLVADVTVAKEGLPAMAIAGCFAGPMFNMLMGLGLSCTIATLREGSINLGDDTDTVNLSFVMLLISLVSSITVVPLLGFTFTRIYGIILICVYVIFLAATILLQTGVLTFDLL